MKNGGQIEGVVIRDSTYRVRLPFPHPQLFFTRRRMLCGGKCLYLEGKGSPKADP